MNISGGKNAKGTDGTAESGRSLNIVFAGGGTAGHVNPLLSIAAAVRKQAPNAVISVIGTKAGLESRLVPAANLPIDYIEKVPFPRGINAAAFRFPSSWIKETRKVREILSLRKADAVVGVGGYAAAPAYKVAHDMGIPLIIHEQNAKAGMANKLGARRADFIGTVYENTGLVAKAENARIERVGLPLRESICSAVSRLEKDREKTREECAKQLGLDPLRPILLVTGGSLGALSVNTAVAKSSRELLQAAQIIHLTGKGKLEQVKKLVAQACGEQCLSGLGNADCGDSAVCDSAAGSFSAGSAGDYHAVEYWERMDIAFCAADLVIGRSGAGTVAEISALGIPAVYVPLPIGNGEQRFNAEPVADASGAIIVNDENFDCEYASCEIPKLIRDKKKLESMSEAAWKYGIRDAAEKMAREIIVLAESYRLRK